MSDIDEFMKQQRQDSNARNAMRAAKIAIKEGDCEEAVRLIDEALGDDET